MPGFLSVCSKSGSEHLGNTKIFSTSRQPSNWVTPSNTPSLAFYFLHRQLIATSLCIWLPDTSKGVEFHFSFQAGFSSLFLWFPLSPGCSREILLVPCVVMISTSSFQKCCHERSVEAVADRCSLHFSCRLGHGNMGNVFTILAALQAGHGSCSVTLCTTGWFGCVSLMEAEQCSLNLLQFSVSLAVISYICVSVQRFTPSLSLCAIQPVNGFHQPLWWYAQEWNQQKPYFKPGLLWVTQYQPLTQGKGLLTVTPVKFILG